MAKTPFFGPFDVTRSTNLADNQCINLRPESVETKQGKNIGALYGVPGLDLLTEAAGLGPINGLREVGTQNLYVVSGLNVYSIGLGSWNPTMIGTVSGANARMCLIDNGTQCIIFSNTGAWAAPAGYFLTGGTIGVGGINYAQGDTIVLGPNNGMTSAAAVLTVTSVVAGAVLTFTILQTGAFSVQPTGFVQKSTTGSGSGFTLTAPVYSPTQGLCQIALPFVPTGNQTISATYQDGFALCNQVATNKIWQSAVQDISVWPALNFAEADGESDNVVALISIHRLVFVVKQRSTEVWNDAGTPGFAFAPLPSVMIEHGASAWGTVQRLNEAVVYLGRSSEGQGIVREIEGFAPRRISTHAIETLIASAPTQLDAFAFTYQQEGHQFYVLTFPSGNFTLVYDKTESALLGVPIWYQWLSFSNGNFGRHWANYFAFFNQTLVIGDFQSQNLYALNLNTLTDNGTPRKWVRSWRAMQQATMQPTRFSSLQIDMQTGVNVPVGTNPLVMLEWSDDGGHTFSAQRFVAVGRPGQTTQRVKFNRLGSTRRNSGLDRIFRLSGTDVFPVALIGAELDV